MLDVVIDGTHCKVLQDGNPVQFTFDLILTSIGASDGFLIRFNGEEGKAFSEWLLDFNNQLSTLTNKERFWLQALRPFLGVEFPKGDADYGKFGMLFSQTSVFRDSCTGKALQRFPQFATGPCRLTIEHQVKPLSGPNIVYHQWTVTQGLFESTARNMVNALVASLDIQGIHLPNHVCMKLYFVLHKAL
jgi:hypothetical protein